MPPGREARVTRSAVSGQAPHAFGRLLGSGNTPENSSTPVASCQKMRFTKVLFNVWRRRRDSNPRDPYGSNGFQDRRIQPLCHSSTLIIHGLPLECEPCLRRKPNATTSDLLDPNHRVKNP